MTLAESIPTGALERLRRVGLMEGASFLLLLGVAMPLKYALGMPLAVRVVGSLHGLLFVLYALLALQALARRWLGFPLAIRMGIASLLPFGPFFIDRQLQALSRR